MEMLSHLLRECRATAVPVIRNTEFLSGEFEKILRVIGFDQTAPGAASTSEDF
jgi:hypothetical protein